MGIIDECYRDSSLTEESIARRVQRQPATLSASFKRETGFTVGEYRRDVRLDHAADLLATTNKTMKEVWSAVGYNHPSNFDHDFKRKFGVTPSEYRRRAIRSVVPPQEQHKRSPPTDTASHIRSNAPATVLIVDDNDDTRNTIGRFLQLEGFTVATAARGAECLERVTQLSPKAILLDYRMPDMDGLECLRALRQRRTAKSPAVALFTADLDLYDREDEVHALDAIIASKLCDLEDVKSLVVYLGNQS